MKSQSAMEYLMTYGWAILIIAVVLSVLFQLGVFSSGNFQPHAQAGACQVSRTAAGVSLEGQCNGLLPQYVGQFSGSGYVTATSSTLATSPGSYDTVSFWMYWTGQTNGMPFGFDAYDLWLSSSTCFGFNTGNGDAYGVNPSPYLNKWTHIVAVFYNGAYTGNNMIYINGVSQTLSQCSGGANNGAVTTNLAIGSWRIMVSNIYTGDLANVQVYNTTLSQTEVTALYDEGIGGAPIRPQNLAGWWPLNGNANDYSGNNNNSQLNNVQFSSSWESGYTAP